MANVADDAARARVREVVTASIYPALQTLRDFLADEYEAHARHDPGISATPGGEAAYELDIRMNTTVSATPDEVHRFGLEDLAHIEAEEDESARRQGHRDRSGLIKALAADPANRTGSPARLIEVAEAETARA